VALMPTYRYYTVDVLGGTTVAELELYGVYMDKVLSGAGNFTGTAKLGREPLYDATVLDGSTPGRYALQVERDDQIVWGGPVWSRTYGAEGSTLQFTARTYESIFERMILRADFVKVTIDQATIFSDLLSQLQAQDALGRSNFSLVISPAFGATGVTRTVALRGTDDHPAQDVIDLLTDADTGLSYTINLVGTSRNIKLFYNAAAAVASDTVLDYPGTLAKYWYTENSVKGALRNIVRANNLRAEATNGTLDSNWPIWGTVFQSADQIDSTALQAKANQLLFDNVPPVPNPAFELNDRSNFTDWDSLGKTITVNIQDQRFPAGKQIISKLIGWSLRPGSSEDTEVITLATAGDT
jgi:hypothetical protein